MWKYSRPVFSPEEPSAPIPEPPAPTPAPVPAATPPATPPEKQPWYLERIDQLTRKNYELTARVEAAQTPPAATPPATPPADGKVYTQAELDQLSNQKAAALVDTNSFNAQCNVVYEKGVAAHPDFQQKLHMLNTLSGGLMQRPLIEAAIEAGNAESLLYELGSKPEVAQEILTLPPAKMAVRLAKMSAELSKTPPAKPVSGAPEPIVPKVGGQTAVEQGLDDPNLSTAEWMAKRKADLQKKRA